MNTCFLFGSGADTSYSPAMKAGDDFSESLLTSKFKKQIQNLLGEKGRNITFIHHNSRKIFAQTVYYNRERAEEIFGKELVHEICEYYEGNIKISENLKKFFKESYDIVSGKIYREEIKTFYLKNAQFFDTLDEKFNSLRFPNNLNNNAKRVISAYWTIYLLMISWLYDVELEDLKFEYLLNLLDQDHCLTEEPDNYYRLLKDSNIDCSVVTTNYTSFAEMVTEKPVIYLHGNLKWFEDISNLTIIEDKDELLHTEVSNLVPFILIPSGVKPLICRKQIEQFGDFIKKLDKANELCVMGYRFNSEDNHINSIINDWMKKEGNHITVFDYGNDINLESFAWFEKYKNIDLIDEITSTEYIAGKLRSNVKITKINNGKDGTFVKSYKNYLSKIEGKK